MPKETKKAADATYPNIARWVDAYGTVEIGYCSQTDSQVRVINEGGMLWGSQPSYDSLDAALADCEQNIARLFRDEIGGD